MGWIIQELVFLEKMSEEAKRGSKASEKKIIRKKSVKSFNHIDEKNPQRSKLEKLYAFYHKLWYCYKKVHSRKKKKKIFLGLNLVSITLVSTGSIVGAVTMNPIVLGILSGLGVLLKTAMEMKNLQRKIQNANVAFTAYAKVLSDLRNFLRGEEWHKEEYL